MDAARRATYGLALLVFLISVSVYMITLTPTVPFWDAGEFIAVSYILGIPHPPGTPLYVLLGRIATLVPWGSVAERVNALSAIPAALAITLTYLTALKLIRLAMGSVIGARAAPVTGAKPAHGAAAKATDPLASKSAEPALGDPFAKSPAIDWHEWVAHAGALCAAFMLAFSDAFWENSIEAEVYALMSFAQALVLWLGLRWWEEHERRPTAGPLLLAVYVMWLSVGLHLGVGIMGVPLLLLIWLVDRKVAIVFLMPLLTVLLVTKGLEFMFGGVLLLSSIVFLVFAARKKLPAIVAYGSAAVMLYPLSIAFADRSMDAPAAIVALAALLVPLALLAKNSREGKILALSLLLMVAGYSTHVYLPIRAAQHPAVNEGAPDNWDKLRDLLERKQYGEMNMFVRRAPLAAQLDKEFWRYFSRQWPVFPTDRLWGVMLPLALGIAGAWWLARHNRTSFLYTGMFFGLTTAGMILFLNFTDHEVRDRDYFFQSGYHAYALWIGLGAAWLVTWVRDSFKSGALQKVAWQLTALLMVAMPFVMMKTLWYTHDRRGNYVAQNYAYNMLAPLAPNSFVFTNGDNDTFPLWYIQQVEGFRKDVRVVNLSLLNTDWYIRQLRDEAPTVPIRLDDPTVGMLGLGAFRDSVGNIIYTSHFMVDHIMNENRNPDGTWKKQPYFAVTVPERMGLDKQFTLEGLVYRVNPDTLGPEVNEDATRRALYETFKYQGLFQKDGTWDESVYKDENAATLSRNYAAAHLQLAFQYRRRSDVSNGIQEMERVARMFPDFTDVMVPLGSFYMDNGDTAKALDLFRKLVEKNPRDAEARYYYGVILAYRGDIQNAMKQLDDVIRIDPSYSMAYYAAYYTLWEAGQRERALNYVERWVQANPTDQQAQQLLEQQRRALGMGQPEVQLRPPVPSLP